MLKRVLGSTLIMFTCFSGVFGVTNFPFPQQAKYPNGIMPAGVSPRHVQSVYDIWLKGYYEESGDQARIKFDEPANTVSEGIGYGMLIMVFMDNEKNNTKGKFDKLWKYYQNNAPSGLMNWKISGFSGVVGSGSATDAELDAAVALIMADKQWGGYLSAATNLIGKINGSEVSGNVFKGGNQWDGKNPSYMSMVATQLFQKVASGTGNWGAVQSGCYALLQSSQNSTTGLWPNWYGSPSVGDNPGLYGFDACRTPWRLGWAYVWYGHADAKARCNTIVNWFKSKTSNDPSKIGQIYDLNGTINTGAKGSEDNIPTFLGPLVVAGMVNSNNYQDWVDKGYTRLRAFGGTDDNYYNECLELLCMLLLTGNMPDLTTATPKTTATLKVTANPTSGGTVTVSPQKTSYTVGETVTLTATGSNANSSFVSWSGDYEGTTATATVKVAYDMTVVANFKDASGSDLVDDCEDNDGLTNMDAEWFTYTDAADKGKSTMTPKTVRGTQLLTMTAGGYNDSKYAVKCTYSLDSGEFKYQAYVGVGFQMKLDTTALDISSSSGVSFVYKGTFGKGDTCAIKCESEAVTELGASYSYTLPASTTWKEISLSWDQFLQPKWVTNTVPLDLKRVPKIQWQIYGQSKKSGEFWIDDIHLIGMSISKKVGTSPQTFVRSGNHQPFECIQSGKTVMVNYQLEHNGTVNLALFDLTGRLVNQVVHGFRNAGSYEEPIDSRDLALSNSSYIIRLSTADGSFTRQLIVNR